MAMTSLLRRRGIVEGVEQGHQEVFLGGGVRLSPRRLSSPLHRYSVLRRYLWEHMIRRIGLAVRVYRLVSG